MSNWFKDDSCLKYLYFFFSEGRFIGIGERIRLPDDVTMGYIIGKYLLE